MRVQKQTKVYMKISAIEQLTQCTDQLTIGRARRTKMPIGNKQTNPQPGRLTNISSKWSRKHMYKRVSV